MLGDQPTFHHLRTFSRKSVQDLSLYMDKISFCYREEEEDREDLPVERQPLKTVCLFGISCHNDGWLP